MNDGAPNSARNPSSKHSGRSPQLQDHIQSKSNLSACGAYSRVGAVCRVPIIRARFQHGATLCFESTGCSSLAAAGPSKVLVQGQ